MDEDVVAKNNEEKPSNDVDNEHNDMPSTPVKDDQSVDPLKSPELKDIMDYKGRGNEYFRLEKYTEAISWYSKGLDECPDASSSDRATLLSNRAAAHMKLSDWASAVKDCTAAIELGPPNEKALERRAISYSMNEEDFDKAIEDYQTLSSRFPERKLYRDKLEELKKKNEERKAKMTEELLRPLKNLGNMFLNPFGLSTDDFAVEKEADGRYTIKTKR